MIRFKSSCFSINWKRTRMRWLIHKQRNETLFYLFIIILNSQKKLSKKFSHLREIKVQEQLCKALQASTNLKWALVLALIGRFLILNFCKIRHIAKFNDAKFQPDLANTNKVVKGLRTFLLSINVSTNFNRLLCRRLSADFQFLTFVRSRI